jgi:ketosteroid isomerase-like protein
MSQRNVEVIRHVFEAWEEGDLERLEARLHDALAPDFEMCPLYFDRIYKGVDGMLALWADSRGLWDDYRLKLSEIVDLDDHVLVLQHLTARGIASGVPIDQRLALLVTFEGDVGGPGNRLSSREAALEAVGLRNRTSSGQD